MSRSTHDFELALPSGDQPGASLQSADRMWMFCTAVGRIAPSQVLRARLARVKYAESTRIRLNEYHATLGIYTEDKRGIAAL
jgi:hypothetical protein